MKYPARLRRTVKEISQAGDTMVEVIVSMAILAVVLATAYATSTHSLQNGLESQYRDQALSYARQQIELIKNADNTSSSAINSYKVGQSFCVDPSTGQLTAVDQSGKCPLPVGASGTNQSQYSVVDSYDSAAKSFKATVQWQSTNANVPNEVVLYYKPSNSFVVTPNSFAAPTSPTSTAPPTVGVTLTVQPTSVAYNGTAKLTWTSSNASGCTAFSNPAGVWSGSKATTSPPGGEQVGPLTASTTFILSCTNGGSNNQAQTNVNVGPAPAPIVSTGSATSVTYSSATLNGTVNPNGQLTTYYFQYGTTTNYGNNTSSGTAGASTTTMSESRSINISASTTYHFRLCANNQYGTVCGGDSTFTSGVAPPSSYPPSSYPPSSYPPSSYPPGSYPPSSYPPPSYPPSSYPPGSYSPSSYPPSSYCWWIFNNRQTSYPSFGAIYGFPVAHPGMFIC